MSSVETGQMSAVETGQMSAAETGQMSAVETRQMSSAETRQMSTSKTGQRIHHSASAFRINNQHIMEAATAADLTLRYLVDA